MSAPVDIDPPATQIAYSRKSNGLDVHLMLQASHVTAQRYCHSRMQYFQDLHAMNEGGILCDCELVYACALNDWKWMETF